MIGPVIGNKAANTAIIDAITQTVPIEPFKDTAHVQCEQYTHQPDIDQRRDDITITFHTGEVSMKLGFDIGVTTPVQSTLLERSLKSNQAVDSLIAATNMFEEKTHKYRNSDYDVYPIIFLATV